jgi:hypothetical protein
MSLCYIFKSVNIENIGPLGILFHSSIKVCSQEILSKNENIFFPNFLTTYLLCNSNALKKVSQRLSCVFHNTNGSHKERNINLLSWIERDDVLNFNFLLINIMLLSLVIIASITFDFCLCTYWFLKQNTSKFFQHLRISPNETWLAALNILFSTQHFEYY